MWWFKRKPHKHTFKVQESHGDILLFTCRNQYCDKICTVDREIWRDITTGGN